MELSRAYNFVRSRELEGTYPGPEAIGHWGVTWNRTTHGWGRVLEASWPYERLFGLQAPNDIDDLAKPFRTGRYQRIRSAVDARKVLAYEENLYNYNEHQRRLSAALPLVLSAKIAVEITRSFLDAPQGIIMEPAEDAEVVGSHSLRIVEDLRAQKSFLFANSWGEQWGDKGYGRISYALVDRWMIEGWAADEMIYRQPVTVRDEERIWQEPDPLGTTFHGVEISNVAEDERLGWAFAVERGSFLEVEEIYVRPQYRLRGTGGRLCSILCDLSKSRRLALRAWVPFVDCAGPNEKALSAALKRLGLTPRKSGVPWAAYQATPGKFAGFDRIRIPSAPAYPRDGVVRHPSAVTDNRELTGEAELAKWASITKRAMLTRAREDEE